MGFNKRFVNAETILNNKKSLDKIFTKNIDTFIFEDNFSHIIYELYINNEKYFLSLLKI